MTFVALDLETTGLDPRKDKIIEVALVKFDEKSGEVLDTFSTLVNPGISVPLLNSNITGITDQMLENAPFFEDIHEDIVKFIGDNVIVGHNVRFDRDFLLYQSIPLKNHIFIDTFFLANTFLHTESSISLEALTTYFGISLTSAHRALDDTNATVEVCIKLLEKAQTLDSEEKSILEYVYSQTEDVNVQFLKDLIFKDVSKLDKKSFQETILKKVGFYIEEDVNVSTSFQKGVEDIFSSGNGLESRENQKNLLLSIEKSFKDSQSSIIEAPTGIGKTLAYLFPSIKFSLETKKQVFISTKSKVLQDQLFNRDIPAFQKTLGINFVYTKIKGQQNYISLQGYFKLFDFQNKSYDEMSCLSKITFWLLNTKSGEIDELNLYGEEINIVKLVYSNLEDIRSDRNPYKEYEFLYKSRRNLEKSNIVILNHSVLFTDLLYKGDISQRLSYLVVDEAHNLEDTITQCLKRRYNHKEVKFFLIEILRRAQEIGFGDFHLIHPLIQESLDIIEEFNTVLQQAFFAAGQKESSMTKLIDFSKLEGTSSMLVKEKLVKVFEKMHSIIGTSKLFFREALVIQELKNLLEIIFQKEYEGQFIQIISQSQNGGISLEYTILNVGEFCKNELWSKLTSGILLSATCRVNDSFEFIKKSIGAEAFSEETFQSDFDYEKQAQIFFINDLGSIKNNLSNILFFLKKFFLKVRGKTLVLFTSFASIKSAYLELNMDLKKEKIILLAQGLYGGKYRILDKFQQPSTDAVILGTDSFWEGIDIPGEALKYLVIHKLPFTVPTDPIFLARSKLYGDSFKEYAIPKAILKLKQGIGRLIRTKKDTGKIILFDDRIFTTQWGEMFIKSFPKDIQVFQVSSDVFLNQKI